MNKSKIEYLTHTWPLITGCNQPASVCACQDQCWARAMQKRFAGKWGRDLYAPDFAPKVNAWLLHDSKPRQPGKRIGIGFTGDIAFADPNHPVPENIVANTLARCLFARMWGDGNQYFILTKSPEKLAAWGQWPDNAWVGASACDKTTLEYALSALILVEAEHKWISFEPVMGSFLELDKYWFENAGISWVVIGGWSRYSKRCPPPKLEWIADIELACDQAGVGIWEKSNLARVLNRPLRQEYP